jgi:exonuclease SbcD
MRILHTADWHLGKKLEHLDRVAEHRLFLDWLLHTLDEQQVDALVVAGDVFDTGSPSNETQRMYYDFLIRLRQTCCRQVVIAGGNHDSASTLNAPRELLRALDIHVIGEVPDQPEDQLIPLSSQPGTVQAVVAAVPFLRDRDVRLSVAGESATEREQRLRDGILAHYASLLPLLEDYIAKGIPVLATGHLYAAGATASDSEKEIHVGSLGQFPATLFPRAYNYIALGHLHRPQEVGGMPHIRYSGSPIPLSFSESTDRKSVVLVDVAAGEPLSITTLSIPLFRPLLRLSGNPDEVMRALPALEIPAGAILPAWVEVQVHTDSLLNDLPDALTGLARQHPGIDQVLVRQMRLSEVRGIAEQSTEALELVDMHPLHVFNLRCQGTTDETLLHNLELTFREALQLMDEQPD